MTPLSNFTGQTGVMRAHQQPSPHPMCKRCTKALSTG